MSSRFILLFFGVGLPEVLNREVPAGKFSGHDRVVMCRVGMELRIPVAGCVDAQGRCGDLDVVLARQPSLHFRPFQPGDAPLHDLPGDRAKAPESAWQEFFFGSHDGMFGNVVQCRAPLTGCQPCNSC